MIGRSARNGESSARPFALCFRKASFRRSDCSEKVKKGANGRFWRVFLFFAMDELMSSSI